MKFLALLQPTYVRPQQNSYKPTFNANSSTERDYDLWIDMALANTNGN